MKVLITGGAGFIGSHLADTLIKQKHRVCIVDNLETGRRDNINKHAEFFHISIEEADKLNFIFDKFRPDVVIHAAASYKDRTNWLGDANVNVVGGLNVIKCCVDYNVRRTIYFQTALIYNTKYSDPSIPVKLDHQLGPHCSYAISKYTTEPYMKLAGLEYISFRLANCYGPRNFSGPISIFYKRLKSGEDIYIADSRRDYVYIDDLVTIVMKSLDLSKQFNTEYHISTGKDFAIHDLYKEVAKCLNSDREVPVQERGEDDVYTILLDPSDTTRDFEHTPEIDISYGIPKAIEYYESLDINDNFNSYTHLNIETK